MKDILTLYQTAKLSGRRPDISAYTEAVQDIIDNDPKSFIPNLEYIITSDINLLRLDDFVEKYGLSIPACNAIIERLEQCIEKCEERKLDSSLYKDYLEKYETYKSDHRKYFDMYEYYVTESDDFMQTLRFGEIKHELKTMNNNLKDIAAAIRGMSSKYNESYYSINSKGVQGNKLAAGMIQKFGEAAIPDMILVAESIGMAATDQLFKYLIEKYDIAKNPIACQWITECAVGSNRISTKFTAAINSNALSRIVESIQIGSRQAIRESAINGTIDDTYIGYSESDIKSITDMISLREYQVACAESAEEASALQNEVYSLYEELDGLVNEDDSKNVYIESKDPKATETKKIIANLNKLAIDVRKRVQNACDGAVKEYNQKRTSGPKGRKFSVRTCLGKDKPFSRKGDSQIIDAISDDIGWTDIKFFSDLKLWMIFTFSGPKPTDGDRHAAREVISAAITTGLRKLMDTGIVSIKENSVRQLIDSFNTEGGDDSNQLVYTHTTHNLTYALPLLVSMNHIMSGVNASVFESMDMSDLSTYIINEYDAYTESVSENNEEFDETLRLSNTRNKFTGDVPAYIGDNHDLSDREFGKITSGSDDDEKSLEDYRRPSAGGASTDDTGSGLEDEDDETPKSGVSKEDQKAINNYYYYTYNNSMNKNSNSFNRSHDSHDDHSTNKRIHSSGDNNGTPAGKNNESYEEGFLDRFKKKDTSGSKPNPSDAKKTVTVVPLSESDKDKLIANIKELDSAMQDALNPLLNKYPIYGMAPHIVNDWKDKDPYGRLVEALKRLGKSLDPSTPYAIEVDMHTGSPEYYIDGIEFAVYGYDQHEFMSALEKEHPEEIKRLESSGKYNMNNKDDWSNIHWMEKLCGYDKCLDEITNEMTTIVKSKFPMVKRFEFTGDNDSGPSFTGDLDLSYILKGINLSNTQQITESWEFGKILSLELLEPDKTPGAYAEAVGEADGRPESDHPIKDALMDVDRKLVKVQQGAKKAVQGVVQTGQVFMKPARRTHQWVTKLIADWKDKDENALKEKIADPKARKGLLNGVTWAIKTGSLVKAGLLLNPIFLFLSISKKAGQKGKESRLRREMIGELQTEMTIIDEKIKDADRAIPPDTKAKYKLYRLKNEINKKLLRVSGDNIRNWRKVI